MCKRISELEENFTGTVIAKRFSLHVKIKKNRYLQKKFLRINYLPVTERVISLAHVLASESLKIVITGVVKWLKFYVIFYEVNVFVLVYYWLFISTKCSLQPTKIYI